MWLRDAQAYQIVVKSVCERCREESELAPGPSERCYMLGRGATTTRTSARNDREGRMCRARLPIGFDRRAVEARPSHHAK